MFADIHPDAVLMDNLLGRCGDGIVRVCKGERSYGIPDILVA